MNSDLLNQALKTFQIQYSGLNSEIVKNTFRVLAKEGHADLNPNLEESIDMDQLKQYKEILLEQCKYEGEKEKSEPRIRLVTSEECFMTNKKFCESCNGYGTTIERVTINRYLDNCNRCWGSGRVLKCNACQGSGLFTQKNTKKVVKCLKCSGTGIFEPIVNNRIHYYNWLRKFSFNMIDCPDCHGTGLNLSHKPVFIESYHHCNDCKGQGYVEIKNPILKSGTLWN